MSSMGAFWSPLPGPLLGFLLEDQGSAAVRVIFRLPFTAAGGPIFGHVDEVAPRNRAAIKTILRARRRHFSHLIPQSLFSSYKEVSDCSASKGYLFSKWMVVCGMGLARSAHLMLYA